METIYCRHCGAVAGSSGGAPEYLITGCSHCGAGQTLERLADQRTVVLDGEFVYGQEQIGLLVQALVHAYGLICEPSLAGFAAMLQYKLDLTLFQDEVSLEGVEVLWGQMKRLQRTLNQIAEIDRPGGGAADNGLHYLGLLRRELYRIIHQEPMPRVA